MTSSVSESSVSYGEERILPMEEMAFEALEKRSSLAGKEGACGW